MRAVFIGASLLARATTELLIEEGHEVVIVEKDIEAIETYSDQYDCSFLHGDGSRPSVLEDVDPSGTDCLYCVSGDDTANILAAVVARSMSFEKIVVRIEDRDLLPVCKQLDIENVIVPDLKVAKDLIAFGLGESENLDLKD